MWNHCSKMGHCNHSVRSSVYHFPNVEHSLSLLLNFSWPQTTITSYVVSLCVKGFLVYRRLENSIAQAPLSLICRTNLWTESVSGMDGAWWMLSGSTISSDLGKYTVIIVQISWQHQKILWVYGPQSGPTLLLRKWHF